MVAGYLIYFPFFHYNISFPGSVKGCFLSFSNFLFKSIQAKTSKSGLEYFRLGAESCSSLGRVGKKKKKACPLLDVFACGQVSSPRLYRSAKLVKWGLKFFKFCRFSEDLQKSIILESVVIWKVTDIFGNGSKRLQRRISFWSIISNIKLINISVLWQK